MHPSAASGSSETSNQWFHTRAIPGLNKALYMNYLLPLALKRLAWATPGWVCPGGYAQLVASLKERQSESGPLSAFPGEQKKVTNNNPPLGISLDKRPEVLGKSLTPVTEVKLH